MIVCLIGSIRKTPVVQESVCLFIPVSCLFERELKLDFAKV